MLIGFTDNIRSVLRVWRRLFFRLFVATLVVSVPLTALILLAEKPTWRVNWIGAAIAALSLYVPLIIFSLFKAIFIVARENRTSAVKNLGIEATAAQLEVCRRFGAQVSVPSPGEKLGIAIQSLDALPLTAVRHVIENGTCGWYIWGGDYSDDPDFYQPLCVEHLARYCPQLLPYLAMAPGWGVVLAPEYEDVWYEEWRAQPAVQSDGPASGGSAG